jgi:hypothetical protein
MRKPEEILAHLPETRSRLEKSSELSRLAQADSEVELAPYSGEILHKSSAEIYRVIHELRTNDLLSSLQDPAVGKTIQQYVGTIRETMKSVRGDALRRSLSESGLILRNLVTLYGQIGNEHAASSLETLADDIDIHLLTDRPRSTNSLPERRKDERETLIEEYIANVGRLRLIVPRDQAQLISGDQGKLSKLESAENLILNERGELNQMSNDDLRERIQAAHSLYEQFNLRGKVTVIEEPGSRKTGT